MQREKPSPSWSTRYGLRGRLIQLVFIGIVPALALILHNAKRDRDVSAARIQEDAERIVEIAASRQHGLWIPRAYIRRIGGCACK